MMQHRVAGFLIVSCVSAGSMVAADDPFVGKWKFNEALSKTTGETEVIEDAGNNSYKFVFGTDSFMLTSDGNDRPSKYGGTMSLKQTGPATWMSVSKRDGKVTSTGEWKLLDGGKMFEEKRSGTRAEGSTFTNVFKAKRLGTGKGLAGTWEATEFKQDSYDEWDIEPNGSDGLAFVTPAAKERLEMKFDGKDYVDKGPRVAPDSTSSGKRVNAKTIMLTDKMKDQLMDHCEMKISADGKMLTVIYRYPGEKKPQTLVYEKQ